MRKRTAETLRQRVSELDALFERSFEEFTLGRLPEERYTKLIQKYENEQTVVTKQLEAISREIELHQDKTVSVEEFIKVIRKHSTIKKLTMAIVREFIDEIHIHQAVRKNGHTTQQIDIYYNCIGMIPLAPEARETRKKVEMETRKGVALCYTPAA